jgi:YfiH family protein
MGFIQNDAMRYYTFELFDEEPIAQGIFTRQGGVSPAPWASLNAGGLSGDERENVVENRRRIFSAFERPVESIFDVWQVHSAEVIAADRPRPLQQAHQKADAIVTDRRELTLFMRFGDCVPILFFDPVRRIIAIAHAGWQGTVTKIVQATVQAMKDLYSCQAQDILAGIGPSICVDHYEFGGEGLERVQETFRNEMSEVTCLRNGKTHFDLWKANRLLLLQCGVRSEHIQISNICTAENTRDWFSHRAEHGKTGRFGALLALK